MANPVTSTINLPGLQPIQVVAVKLPDGTIALRHPSELKKLTPQIKMTGGK